MSILSAKTNALLTLGITLIFAIFLPFFSQNIAIIGLFVLIIYWGVIALAVPKFGLGLLLFLRPCLDFWSNLGLLSIGEKNLNLASMLSLVLLIVALAMMWQQRRRINRLPLSLPWLAWLLISGLSIIWSVSAIVSLAEILRLFSFFALFFYGYTVIDNTDGLEKFLKVIILSGLIPSIFAIVQFLTNTGLTVPFEGIYNRIYGTFAHPNLFAYYLLLPIISAAYFIIRDPGNTVIKYFYGSVMLGYTGMLVLTFTRGAWLALAIIVAVIGIMRYRVLLVGAFLAVVLAYFFVTPIQSRLNDLVTNPYSSIDWRQDLWRDASGYTKIRPLTGQGVGVAKDYIAEKRGPQFGSSDPHNDYLKVLLETGYLGLVAYVALLASLLYGLWRKYRLSTGPARQLTLLFLCLSIALFSLSYADNVLRNTALQWAFWALAGGILRPAFKA